MEKKINKSNLCFIYQLFLNNYSEKIKLKIKPNEGMVKLINEVDLYVENFIQHLSEGEGMVWFGHQKTIKSVLALYVANALMETQFKVRHEFSLSFLKNLENREDQTLEDFYPDAELAQLLIIDDCEEECYALSESKRDILNRILTIREYKRLPTILITKFSKTNLHHLVGDKIAHDLLNSNYLQLNFDWDQSYYLTEKSPC